METRSIKYFLHLYLGCECLFIASGSEERRTEQGVLVEMPFKGTEWGIIHSEFLPHEVKIYAFVHDIKPILRPLSDMTEEEKIMLCCLNLTNEWKPGHIIQTNDEDIAAMRVFDHKGNYKSLYIPKNKISPSNFLWLLSKHFDLFGLIESGLAIDKTTLTNK